MDLRPANFQSSRADILAKVAMALCFLLTGAVMLFSLSESGSIKQPPYSVTHPS